MKLEKQGLTSLLEHYIQKSYPKGIVAVFFPEDYADIHWDCINIVEFDDMNELNKNISATLASTYPDPEFLLIPGSPLQEYLEEEGGDYKGGISVYVAGRETQLVSTGIKNAAGQEVIKIESKN